MCQTREIPRYTGLAGCTCGCCGCGCGPAFRSFFTAKEEQERLETYKDRLEKELAGVKECLNELKGK